uniref:Uncharacterized protein n=1 Tax=Anopheles atroparvus TaxID=41427 RepID=A0A182IX81_ANOAO
MKKIIYLILPTETRDRWMGREWIVPRVAINRTAVNASEAKRARRKLDSAGLGAAPLALLLDGLRRLSSEMSFGAVSSHSVAQRVHRLIGEFERCKPLTVTDRQEGWRQVLRLLLVLRTVGGLGPGERDPQSDAGRAKDLQEVERQTGNRPPNNKAHDINYV